MARTTGSLSRYIVQRILLIIPMVWILLTLVFVLLRVAPGDPVSASLGGRLSPAALAARRHDLGLDRPLINQYFSYVWDVMRGDFGTTFTDRQPVLNVVKENGGATLTLTTAAFLIALLIGIPLGRLAARYRDTPLDVGIRLFGIVTYAAPIFFVGLLAKLLFAVKLNWVDTSGMASPITTFEVPTRTHILLLDALLAGNMSAVRDVLSHLILPAFTLALLICGIFIRLVRVNLIQTLQGDYVEAARARGISESRVIRKHAFRNALVPVITVVGLQIALLMSGALLTEITFNWPGIGYKLYSYLLGRDYGAVQGIIIFFALVVVAVSALVDIINALVDPRVRY
jgi:peptide/nickel transport system permease protein